MASVNEVYGPGFQEGVSCRWAQQGFGNSPLSACGCDVLGDGCGYQWYASPAPSVPWAVVQDGACARPGVSHDPRGMLLARSAYSSAAASGAAVTCSSCFGK
jgi:hypothetical protein